MKYLVRGAKKTDFQNRQKLALGVLHWGGVKFIYAPAEHIYKSEVKTRLDFPNVS